MKRSFACISPNVSVSFVFIQGILMGDIPPEQKKHSDIAFEANPMREPMLAIAESRQRDRRALSVALIQVPRYRQRKREARDPFTGTGWLIAPGLVLTCWHVVAALAGMEDPFPTPEDLHQQIRHMLVIFNHVEAGAGIQYKVKKLEFSGNEADLQDFVLLRLDDRRDYSYRHFRYLPIERNTPFNELIQLSIIQHPLGDTQQVPSTPGCFAKNSPQTEGRILYTTATDKGASGAPVLNCYNWHVVALHNGENKQEHLREGTHIEHILNELRDKKPDLYNEVTKAQNELKNTWLPFHLMPLFDSYMPDQNIASQVAFASASASVQEAAFSSGDQQVAVSPEETQQYDYKHTVTWKCSSEVSCLAFHPDGHSLASCDYTNAVKIWDIPTGRLRYTLKMEANIHPALAFSPDGTYLAVGGNDGTITIWRFATQKRVKTMQGHNEWISRLAFSSDGHHLVSGSDDRLINIRDTVHWMLIRSLKEVAEVVDIALHPHEPLIASCITGQNLKLENIISPQMSPSALLLTDMRCLIFSPNGRYLVAGSGQGSLAICETASWQVAYTLTQHARSLRCLAFHPNGALLASGGDDGVIQLWNAPNGKNIKTLVKHIGSVKSLAFSPDGQYIASGGKDASIILWKRV